MLVKHHLVHLLSVCVLITTSANAELVSFVPPLPEGWTKAGEEPVSDSKGTIGNFVAYQSNNQKQSVIIQVSRLSEKDLAVTFEKSAQDWKDGLLDSFRAKKREPQEINFRLIQAVKQPEAELSFQVQGNQNLLYYYAKCHRSDGRLISTLAMGKGVRTKDDAVVTNIVNSVVVK